MKSNQIVSRIDAIEHAASPWQPPTISAEHIRTAELRLMVWRRRLYAFMAEEEAREAVIAAQAQGRKGDTF